MIGRKRQSDMGKRSAKALLSLCFLFSVIETPKAQPEESASEPACLYSGPSALGTDETLCIRKDSFNRDLCVAIEHFASANQLPPDYFARLIWRESTFRPDAVSFKGAQGIAQFMPGTAKLRGLEDSYQVLEALRKSAQYLDELRDRFGNLGLAAAAYNAGENGLASYLASGRLPHETRGYVMAITAHTVEEWKDNPPEDAAAPLDKDKPFLDGCVALAERRTLKEAPWRPEGDWAPWGVQLAANANVAVARRMFVDAVQDLPAPLNAEQPLILRQRDRSFGFRPRYAARIGRQTRVEADNLCNQIRKHGGTCLVFRNR
ncbi:lytic transglycosylase domain-containing protein [Rhizobium hidalgonense]|uniref:Glycosyl transferase n=1 Tax=Rhizobium hidalgonense TaxID=1538159 RepID=A0A2A6KBT4_9HYPH|nr:lytic transglycosylase domain-containing protein [Rhizobium hidalgonense]MDR9774434.1 lytic transglycosylase domain-containing protein [Rhizobium hidalgonense]MDR9805192.1 lytic transglycosylase domain-containing protein [Rhizobium hidalgonense]MDR9809583.1 lytic transglycosylase domain-containing protein [Rhizobium hidalgonense]MDR9821070.1 lytic transglycosylase domain-containing protein [Rhizobium hidalgonense]PDT22366.1 glycosyl transferase [Rhizobium hidalgonense]